MPLVNAKCTNCGANLRVEDAKDAAICSYCGSAYIVEKAVHNYNMINNNSIYADTVNIYETMKADFEIRAGVLVGYNGNNADVVIPNSVDVIGGSAFKECTGLRSVVFPSGITEIEEQAFSGCIRLENVSFSSGLTKIGRFAFSNCRNLQQIVLPDSVVEIENGAFYGCISLTNIVLSEKLQKIGSTEQPRPFLIGDGVFSGCISLTHISIPGSCKHIGKFTFSDCVGLKNVMIPAGVLCIDEACFRRCTSLKSIVIPDTVVDLGPGVFWDCSELSDVKMPNHLLNALEIEYSFRGTKWEKRQVWRKQGNCEYCGGSFKGVFAKKCVKCGHQKSY